MRVSEDRYTRDLRRLNLAQRLIRHEVRTQWICAWTGLSDDRVRNLFRSYHRASGEVTRHRGPSPTRLQAFLRSPALRSEASAIGGLACTLGVVPPKGSSNVRRERSTVEAGERLCEVFELYRHIAPQSDFTMDQFFVLMEALGDGEDLAIGHCRNCHGALLIDPLGASRRLCTACKEDSVRKSVDAGGVTQPRSDAAASLTCDEESPVVYQQSLF
jgi:hypothetical protein